MKDVGEDKCEEGIFEFVFGDGCGSDDGDGVGGVCYLFGCFIEYGCEEFGEDGVVEFDECILGCFGGGNVECDC